MTQRRVLVVDVCAGETLDITPPSAPGTRITVKLVHKSGLRARLMVLASADVVIDHNVKASPREKFARG